MKKHNNTYFTSDSHFFHENIIRYSSRPFKDANEMNEALIENWNYMVKPEDTVWHLGDFVFCSIGKFKTLLSRLNGNINVVLGNHDRVIIKNCQSILESKLLASVQSYKEITIEGQHVVLFHYSLRTWNRGHRGSWCLWGHSHGTLPPFGKSVDVGVDCTEISTDYRPYSFKEIKEYMNKKEPNQIVEMRD